MKPASLGNQLASLNGLANRQDTNPKLSKTGREPYSCHGAKHQVIYPP